MPSPTNRDSLPFEPKSKTKNKNPQNPAKSAEKQTTPSALKSKNKKQNSSLREIPEVVSKRMVRRMALFSGVPTGLGIFSFFVFYAVVSQEWFKVPNTAVLLVSMGLFGLGVLGLSYGILSTSWDEHRVGTWWGWSDFTVNFGRLTSAWKNAKQKTVNDE
jgi:UDP-N-acetylmuramyl pentapeptide phosphotransferase/UDP-N-acetylglucosamine-1-phosphate transferase